MYRTIGAFAVAMTLAAVRGRASAKEPDFTENSGQIGRYQLVRISEDRLFLIDTATGHCWSRATHGSWRDEGQPNATDTKERPARESEASVPTLDLPYGSVDLVVMQRESKAIPGSNGTVRIRLEDITEGQVLASVVTSHKDILMERVSARQGDTLRFSVENKQYTIHFKELRNILLGTDFARLTVTESPEESSIEPDIDNRPK